MVNVLEFMKHEGHEEHSLLQVVCVPTPSLHLFGSVAWRWSFSPLGTGLRSSGFLVPAPGQTKHGSCSGHTGGARTPSELC